jgi:hypothetical protein
MQQQYHLGFDTIITSLVCYKRLQQIPNRRWSSKAVVTDLGKDRQLGHVTIHCP